MKKEILEKLKTYFEGRDEVVMAFLFGSRFKGNARAVSDWDIGVYLTSESRVDEQKIWLEVERICGAEVDLVILNRASPRVVWSIIRGEPLVIKDRRIYLDVLTNTSHNANDWYRTAEDYHRVFERSSSLSREDRSRLEKIIQFLEVETSDFPKFEKMTWDDYSTDRSKKREIERWAEQIMNAVIDAAEIVLASERRVIPETYKEIVKILGLVNPFDNDNLCAALAEWTALRNLLAHEYLDYRWKQLAPFIAETKPLLHDFTDRIREFLSLSPIKS